VCIIDAKYLWVPKINCIRAFYTYISTNSAFNGTYVHHTPYMSIDRDIFINVYDVLERLIIFRITLVLQYCTLCFIASVIILHLTISNILQIISGFFQVVPYEYFEIGVMYIFYSQT